MVQRMVWRWPKPRSPSALASEAKARGVSGGGVPVHEEERPGGTGQHLLRADPASDEQRGGEEVGPTELGVASAATAAVAGRGDGREGPAGRTGRRRCSRRFGVLCWGRARERCDRVVRHHHFEVGTMVLVFASSVTLVLQSPLDDPSRTKTTVLTVVDLSMTFLFSCEMIVKVRDGGQGTRESTLPGASTSTLTPLHYILRGVRDGGGTRAIVDKTTVSILLSDGCWFYKLPKNTRVRESATHTATDPPPKALGDQHAPGWVVVSALDPPRVSATLSRYHPPTAAKQGGVFIFWW